MSTNIKVDEPFLHDGTQTMLHVKSLDHFLHLFINEQLEGSVFGSYSQPYFTKDPPSPSTWKEQNQSLEFDRRSSGPGITGPVELEGLTNGSTVDLSSKRCTYQVGLRGESLRLDTGGSRLWRSGSPKSQFDLVQGHIKLKLKSRLSHY